MKSLVAASVISLLATSAMAMGGGGYHPGPMPDPDSVDLEQVFVGIQAALNTIEGATDVDSVKQEAVNAANLIDAATQSVDNIDQSALGLQIASNYIDFSGTFESEKKSIQSATNILNSVSVDTASSITQGTLTGQVASNVILGVDTGSLAPAAFHGGGGFPGPKPAPSTSDISNVAQEAVNAANLADLGTFGSDLEVTQFFSVGQLASNFVGGAIDSVSSVSQSATNIANSISVGD